MTHKEEFEDTKGN